MTTEEKAKAYDEALERAKEIMNNTCSSETTKVTCQEIFPELAESEDERIKGCIGVILTDATEQRFTDFGVSLKDCLDWLEKQKEQKSNIEKLKEISTPANEDWFKIQKWWEKEDEQKEQKPEWSEEDEDMLNCCISSIEEAKENRYYYRETDGDTSYDHEIFWLKSLRPRPHWVPSEEQIYSLGTVVKGAGDNSVGSIAYNLKELYEQLKKLM